MNVRKSSLAANPGYPNRRQFPEYRRLVGMAAIGLSAAIGQGQEGRFLGDIAVDPRTAGAPPANVKPVSVKGGVRADPGNSCTATNLPSAGTNSVPPVTPPPVSASTNKPAIVERKPGEMPAEPKR